jgi:hypothetical protein
MERMSALGERASIDLIQPDRRQDKRAVRRAVRQNIRERPGWRRIEPRAEAADAKEIGRAADHRRIEGQPITRTHPCVVR